ncbi:Odorant receptor Or85 [Rhyzopertha dominica]|nr:Odorant receptor Or85 [Rhyzopertha dominica]
MKANPQPFQDDYLPFFRKAMMLYYENVFVKMLCKIYLPLYLIIHATTMADSLIRKRTTDSLYNTMLLMICIHEVLTVVMVEAVYHDIMHMDEIMRDIFWSQTCVPKRLKQNIRQLTQAFKIFLSSGFVGIIIIWISAVLFGIHPDWPIIDKNNPIQYAIFLAAFMVHSIGACIIVFVYSCIFFYTCIHVYVQMALLTEYLRKLSYSLTEIKEDQLNRSVKEGMLCIIKQHCKLSMFAKKVTQTFSLITLAILLTTGMVTFSICLYFIIKRREYTMIIFLVSFFGIPSLYCITGELFSFGFEEFSSQLYNCCWYKWNKENRRTVLLFLIFTQHEQVIQVFPAHYARMRYILWTIRALYSVLTLLKSTQF